MKKNPKSNDSPESNNLNIDSESKIGQTKEDTKSALEQEMMASGPQYIANKVMKANPGIELKFGKTSQALYSSVDGESLVVPDGYTYNEKNGFTNKHLTKSGVYGQLPVRPLENYDSRYEEY